MFGGIKVSMLWRIFRSFLNASMNYGDKNSVHFFFALHYMECSFCLFIAIVYKLESRESKRDRYSVRLFVAYNSIIYLSSCKQFGKRAHCRLSFQIHLFFFFLTFCCCTMNDCVCMCRCIQQHGMLEENSSVRYSLSRRHAQCSLVCSRIKYPNAAGSTCTHKCSTIPLRYSTRFINELRVVSTQHMHE